MVKNKEINRDGGGLQPGLSSRMRDITIKAVENELELRPV